MRPYGTSVCGLKLLGADALRRMTRTINRKSLNSEIGTHALFEGQLSQVRADIPLQERVFRMPLNRH
jgi:hypothetical protein